MKKNTTIPTKKTVILTKQSIGTKGYDIPITSVRDKETVCMTRSLYTANVIAGIIEGNGYEAKIERVNKKDVKLNELELVQCLE